MHHINLGSVGWDDIDYSGLCAAIAMVIITLSKHINEAEGQSLIIGTNSLPLMMLGPAQSQKRRRASLQTQSGSSGNNRRIMT